MNINQFRECLDLLSYSGFTLTEMESARIENSLIILQNEYKLCDIFFLARIETTGVGYYYIAFGYIKDILKDQQFFYSTNGYEWFVLPRVKPKRIEIAKKIKSYFQGDPAHVDFACLDPREFVIEDDGSVIPCHRSLKKIKEEDRLSCFVARLIHDSAVLPRGVLYRQVTQCITFNPCFRGLSRLEAENLKNFQHFRTPINGCNQNLLKREDYNYQTDFFDTIDDDNSFSAKINDRNIGLIRSLKYPGMISFHKLNSMYQGFVYLGNGQENLDWQFMIPI
ncbi:CLUMA_CG003006, isoform A [Clunio marinus]|uniref:Radial spoke head protein 9 homolog n=1 Tax=Clunio marinus TaxID=568069 RepID=A0A1J1HMG7_9DIPT|nr:CLUMA_CG003006, isoform A [Clunio marinus]